MIPIILGALAIGSAVAGVGAGIKGLSDRQEAEKIVAEIQKEHQACSEQLNSKWQATQAISQKYGKLQLEIKQRSIAHLISYLEKIGQRSAQDRKFLESLEGLSISDIQAFKGESAEAFQLASGGVQSISAGAAAAQGTLTLVGLVGTASTGTAIGTLSGAAAQSATLAWLGGGSLAAGGGGMALGSLVLGGITIGPAIAVGGFMFAGDSEKYLTKAQDYVSEHKVKVENMRSAKALLVRVDYHIEQISYVVTELNNRAAMLLSILESHKVFDRLRDTPQLQEVVMLIKSLSEIMNTPIINENGNINPLLDGIYEKYGQFD
jgi:hypothetical protein